MAETPPCLACDEGFAHEVCTCLVATPENPLHVRVAEALGWEWGTFCGVSILMPPGRLAEECWPGSSWKPGRSGEMREPEQAFFDSSRRYPLFPPVPRFDTAWSATGPLIEKYGIELIPRWDTDAMNDAPPSVWDAMSADRQSMGSGQSPLGAVCELILRLAEAGHSFT